MDGFTTILGRPVHYQKEGNGPPLVLAHGLGGSLTVWRKAIELLSNHFTVYAVSLLGHGQSGDIEDREMNLSFGVLFLEEFRRTFAIDRPILVGGSMGGLLVIQYALYFPEKVKSIVLVDSAGLGKEIGISLRLESLPLLGEYFTRATKRNIKNTIKIMVTDASCVPEDMLSQMQKDRRKPGNRRALLKMLRYGVNVFGQREEFILVKELSKIQVPTLIIWGDKDIVVPVEHGRQAAKSVPNAKLRIISNASHWPHVQHPEEFTEVIREFAAEKT